MRKFLLCTDIGKYFIANKVFDNKESKIFEEKVLNSIKSHRRAVDIISSGDSIVRKNKLVPKKSEVHSILSTDDFDEILDQKAEDVFYFDKEINKWWTCPK
jgi:hypothetical protein